MPPDGPVAEVKAAFLGFFERPPWTPPSAGALAEFLDDGLDVTEIADSAMRRIEFSHEDPQFAVKFLSWLHKEVDELVREQAAERATVRIGYIQEKLNTVTVAEYREALIQLLSDQEMQMMMIQVDLPFSARIIEPPMVSDAPTFPKPFRLLALGAGWGFFVGILLLFLIDSLRGGQTLPRESRNL